VFQRQHRLDEAARRLAGAIIQRERAELALGPMSGDAVGAVVVMVNNLALLKRKQGAAHIAVALYRRAVEISEAFIAQLGRDRGRRGGNVAAADLAALAAVFKVCAFAYANLAAVLKATAAPKASTTICVGCNPRLPIA
jgi:hypothetical protein